jgi:hypothetical protein
VSYYSSGKDDDDEEFDQNVDSASTSSSDDGNGSEQSRFRMHEISHVMAKCRSIVNSIRKSSILYEIFRILARGSSLNAGLVIDMLFRWNSSFKMLQRLLLYQPILDKVYEQFDSLTGITQKHRAKLIAAKLTGAE